MIDSDGIEQCGPRPYDALQAFGGRVERWRGLGEDPNESNLSSRSPVHLRFSSGFSAQIGRNSHAQQKMHARSNVPSPRKEIFILEASAFNKPTSLSS